MLKALPRCVSCSRKTHMFSIHDVITNSCNMKANHSLYVYYCVDDSSFQAGAAAATFF